MRRFVLGTDRTTAEQDSAFFEILRTRWPYLGWWHQLSETWLIADASNTLTIYALRDAAREAFPGVHLMVVEAKGPRSWAGFGPKRDTPGDMFTWMSESWDRDD